MVGALVLTVAGCSGSGSDQPKVLPPVPSATVAVTPTPTTTALPMVVPSAAVPATPQGAAAFARFYFDRLNEAFRQASPSLTHSFVDPACKTCANFTAAVNRVHIAGDHVVGQVFSVVSAEAAPPSQGFVLVDMFVDLPSTSQVNASGKVVDVSAKQPRLHYSVFLRRVATHWLVRAVQDAK